MSAARFWRGDPREGRAAGQDAESGHNSIHRNIYLQGRPRRAHLASLLEASYCLATSTSMVMVPIHGWRAWETEGRSFESRIRGYKRMQAEKIAKI